MRDDFNLDFRFARCVVRLSPCSTSGFLPQPPGACSKRGIFLCVPWSCVPAVWPTCSNSRSNHFPNQTCTLDDSAALTQRRERCGTGVQESWSAQLSLTVFQLQLLSPNNNGWSKSFYRTSLRISPLAASCWKPKRQRLSLDVQRARLEMVRFLWLCCWLEKPNCETLRESVILSQFRPDQSWCCTAATPSLFVGLRCLWRLSTTKKPQKVTKN